MTPAVPRKRVIPIGWLGRRRHRVSAGISVFQRDLYPRESCARCPVQACIVPILLPMFLAGYTLLIGYIYGDARRRGMRYVMWTLLAIFLFNGIGIILYFILREPLHGVLFALRRGRTAQSRILPALRSRCSTRLPGMPPYDSARLDPLRLVRKSVVRLRRLWGTIPSTP